MPTHLVRTGGCCLAAVFFVIAGSTCAVITSRTPLNKVITDQEFITTLKVDKLDAARPAAVFSLTADLKGKFPFKRLPVNLTGDDEAKKGEQSAAIVKRLAPDLPLILFANKRGKRLTAFVYTNGTWFQMVGEIVEGRDEPVWAFTHGEPFLRRTFKGTTEELKQVIVDGLAGKKDPPEPNEKEPPGFGPEVTPMKSGHHHGGGGPLFAVIPTIGIGAPLAILAILFPSLFGGFLVLFRQWTAFIFVLGTNLTIWSVYAWFSNAWYGTWWDSPLAQWSVMSAVTLLGALWAYRRQVRSLDGGAVPHETPHRTENLVLGALCMSGAVAVGICLWMLGPRPFEPWWNLLEVMTVAVFAGALYKVYVSACGRSVVDAQRSPPSEGIVKLDNVGHRPFPTANPRRPLTTEGVMLWTALAGCLAVFVLRPTQVAVASEHEAAGKGRPVAELQEKQDRLVSFQAGGGGMVASSPLIHEGKAYVGVAHRKGLENYGVLYCFDLETEKMVWEFDADGKMQQIMSSPRLAEGKLFLGEGFHDGKECKVYCIDAATGKQVWAFTTGSQTESSPGVAHGRVYIGAGNDGLYALNAKSGEKVWQFPADPKAGRLLRIGANPLVVGKRLYVGSGVDRDQTEDQGETALLCLDADTGKQLWKTAVDLPCWAEPIAAGNHVYFALGNGDVVDDHPTKPAGAMVCVDAETGKQVWRLEVPNGVLNRPALDRHRLYFGARDGVVYCINRHDGKERWKKGLGSPVVASVVLEQGSDGGQPSSLFAITVGGAAYCLDPFTGQVHWSHTKMVKGNSRLISSPSVVLTPTAEGDRRRIYFGAALNSDNLPALIRLEDLLPDR